MKIERVPSSKLVSQYINVKPNTASASSTSQGTDKVELTNASQTFSAALKEAKQAFETRTTEETKRINEVKQMISENSYQVSGEDVAAKILGMDE